MEKTPENRGVFGDRGKTGAGKKADPVGLQNTLRK